MGINYFFQSLFLLLLGWVPLNWGEDVLKYERNNIEIYNKVIPSVAEISIFGYFPSESSLSFGSGIVLNKKGYIVTNFHVVSEALNLNEQGFEVGVDKKIFVSFFMDEVDYEAEYIGGDPYRDIALIRLKKKPSKLVPIGLGTSEGLQVGQGAIAIGHPWGMDYSAAYGFISRLDRQEQLLEGGEVTTSMIQVDMDINPGNSGGPLVNTSGKLIGMNTLTVTPHETSIGLGLAITVDTIKRSVAKIIRHGRIVKMVDLGILIIPDDIKGYFGVEQGVVVESVESGGPAEGIGIRGIKTVAGEGIYLGDVIIKIDAKEVNSFNDIYQVLENYEVDEKINVTYIRSGKKKTSKLKLGLKSRTWNKSCSELLNLPPAKPSGRNSK